MHCHPQTHYLSYCCCVQIEASTHVPHSPMLPPLRTKLQQQHCALQSQHYHASAVAAAMQAHAGIHSRFPTKDFTSCHLWPARTSEFLPGSNMICLDTSLRILLNRQQCSAMALSMQHLHPLPPTKKTHHHCHHQLHQCNHHNLDANNCRHNCCGPPNSNPA